MFFRQRIMRGEHLFGGRESHFQKGDLKYVVLDLLKDKPRYGYEIIRELEERSFGFYTPSAGAVYPTLQMLEEMGYASATEQDGKKVYTITDEGRQFLTERKDFAEEVKSQMRHRWNPESIGDMGQVRQKWARLGKLMGRFHHGDPGKMKRVRDVISRAYREIESIMEEEE
jgi:DNA-binding PadR family transcriptional regulator